MDHYFDIEHARKYGVIEAIFIEAFSWWITGNRANRRNQNEGRTWSYNSVKAFSELFPYLTAKQIRRALQSLIDHKVLMTGNFNTSGYDRTLWYAFTDESLFLPRQVDSPKKANGAAHEGNRLDIKEDNQEEETKRRGGTGFLFAFASDKLPPPLDRQDMRDAWDEWQLHCRQRGRPLTERAAAMQIKRLQSFGPDRAIAAIEHSIEKNWQSVYEPKESRNGSGATRSLKDIPEEELI